MRLTVLLLLTPGFLAAQIATEPVQVANSVPTGTCRVTDPLIRVAANPNGVYQCAVAVGQTTGTYQLVGPGAGGPGGGTFTSNVSVAPTTVPYYANAPASDTIVGTGAGNSSTTGKANTVFGAGAGAALTTPSAGAGTADQANTIIGYQACSAMTTGRESVCLGYQAGKVWTGNAGGLDDGEIVMIGSMAGVGLQAAGSGGDIFIGQKAGEGMVTAANCDVIGTHGADTVQTCTNSIFLGSLALGGTGTGYTSLRDFYGGYGVGPVSQPTGSSSYNVMIGDLVGNNQVNPTTNVFIGSGVASLGGPVSTGDTVLIGPNAGQHIAGTQFSTGVGSQALQALTTGTGNSAFGKQACAAMTTDYDCNGFGFQALYQTTGHRNVGIGTLAGGNLTSGTQNIFIGDSAQPSAASDTNEIVIGHLITGNGPNTTTIGSSATTSTYLSQFVYAIHTLNPTYTLKATSNAADQKIWDTLVSGTSLNFRAANDAYTLANTWMQVNRGSGYTISSLDLTGSNLVKLPVTSHASQSVISSASTIAPTTQFFHVSGTVTVQTITAPSFCTAANTMCQITIIPDGVFATNTSGNIALASTTVVNKALIMTYDPTTSKWYPSY